MIEIKRNYEVNEAGVLLYEAKENGAITATLSGTISDGVFHINSYEGDKYLFDGLCRTALNNAEHEGASCAVIEPTVPDWQIMLFGYQRDIPSIFDFFEQKNCDCTCKSQPNNV